MKYNVLLKPFPLLINEAKKKKLMSVYWKYST